MQIQEIIVARIGGDEFAILLPNASALPVEQYLFNAAEEIATRLCIFTIFTD